MAFGEAQEGNLKPRFPGLSSTGPLPSFMEFSSSNPADLIPCDLSLSSLRNESKFPQSVSLRY